jgi:cell division protein ZapA
MKQFEVEIMGQLYVLGCPEGGEHRLHAAVAQVDDTMNRIRDAGKVRARDRIAVLAALNLALELVDHAHRPVEPPAPAAPALPDPAADAVDPQDAARLQALLERLDEALAQDATAAEQSSAGSQPPDAASSSPVPASAPRDEAAAPAHTAAGMEDDGDALSGGNVRVAEAASDPSNADPDAAPARTAASEAGGAVESADPASRSQAGDSFQNSDRPARALHG